MVIIHAYTPLHFMQLKYLLEFEVLNEKSFIIVPKRFLSNVIFLKSDMCDVIYYNFDASSYTDTYFLSKANCIFNEIPIRSIRKIIVPDIAYSLSNYLVSSLIRRNSLLEVSFYFDGSGSMMSSPVTFKTMISDILKQLLSLIVSDSKYIKRNNELSGADLSICDKQLSIINNVRLTYSQKVKIVPELIDLPNSFQATEKIVIFVLQDAKVLMPGYLGLYKSTLRFLSVKYPNYKVKLLLRNNDHEHYFHEKEIIVRDFVGESAESIISRLKPKVVISHYSTVLLTLAFSKYRGEILSFSLSEYNKLVGEKQEVTDEVSLIFDALGINLV